MSPEQVIEMLRASCDKDKVDPEQNGFWVIVTEELVRFAHLVAQLEKERIATSIERLPFGDTAASFAIYVRELKDDTK